MEAMMDVYKQEYKKVGMQYLLAFPMQIAEQVRQGVEETDSFKQECADVNKKVETVLQLLRQAARVYSSSSTTTTKLQQSSPRGGLQLYERPTRHIMLQVTKALYRALVLVRKCKKIGILMMVISSITNTTADFKNANLSLGNSIADITWLLSISTYGEDRPEVSGLPPIASADPVLATVWEQVSIVQFGTPDKKAEAADYLGTCAKGNQRYLKIIVQEEGVPPLLRLLKEGTLSGQEAAARALGQLARDPGRIKSMVEDGAPAAFVHVLGNHATSMKVQIEVARTISLFASQDEEVQNELALLGAIRLLVALLAHDLIDDTALKVTNNKSASFHSIVQSLGEQKVQADGACDSGQASTQDLTGQTGNHLDTDLEPAPVGLEPGSVVTHGRRSTTYCQSTRQTSALHQGNQNPQDKLEDPEIKLILKAEAAHALWKLAANNVNNSKLITDTCALLCFSKLIETGHRTVKYNSIMAIMEITAAAEKDSKFRTAAFRTNSAAVKAVVECLLQVLEAEADEPNLQAPCAKALGSLAHIFPARARAQITPLTRALGSENRKVAAECAIALSKFANKENYLHLEHSKTILEQGATDHLVQLVSFGDEGDANGKIHALQLLCFLSLHAATSDDALAATLPALLTVRHSPLLTKHENIRPLLMNAISKLKLYQSGSSHVRATYVP
ncbi:unnamed protein product [Sphagnum troendelagicum]|uniref:DUF7792 domain-containing protein n=1 Tax=Sphagnum troendelagicum TaxID=128251 RepID=A0ABP0TDU3_9BRYO